MVNTFFIIVKAIDTNPANTEIYNGADEYFLYIYTVEMFVKIFSDGFVVEPDSYLRDSWNVLDFFIIISGWISKFLSVFSDFESDIGLNVIRSFRLMRPLMGLKIFPALRNILLSIGRAIIAIREITTIIIFLFIIYAVMGLQVY